MRFVPGGVNHFKRRTRSCHTVEFPLIPDFQELTFLRGDDTAQERQNYQQKCKLL